MKRLFASLALLLLAAAAPARPVDADAAKKLAAEFFQRQSAAKAPAEFVEVASPYQGLHLLNAANGQGFVIVAADDRATAVLAYSPQGSLRPNALPPAMRYWLQRYNEQVLLAANGPEYLRRSAAKSADSVPPLLVTTWNQGKYYNDACPADNALHGWDLNGHPYTGCTATAMAQVMKYWNWPPHGVGSYSYSWSGYRGYNWRYGTLSADFENTVYDWQHMPPMLTAQSSDTEVLAVSTLIYHCGVATQMGYNDDGEGGSGAYVTLVDMHEDGDAEYCAENALYTFFAYKPSVRGLCRDDYPDSLWADMLRDELRAGRPVIYQGYTGTGWYAYGHCFVLDGFNSAGQFHVNWGWDGDCDGFFALSALCPYQPYTYSYYQEGLFYLEPDYLYFDSTLSAPAPSLQPAQCRVVGRRGRIEVSGAEGLDILAVDMLGRTVYRGRAQSAALSFAVPAAGLYVVRTGSLSHKVAVLR